MGKLIEGQWYTDEKIVEFEKNQYKDSNGKFIRGTANFRNWITKDGEPGSTGKGGFKAEDGRYHLFAAINCPWAHRTLIYRNIKKLKNLVGLSIAAPIRSDQGWVFNSSEPRFTDELLGLSAVHQLYTIANPKYSGRVTVPVLWDKKLETIVSNESSEIIRMFNSEFNHITGDTQDFYPKHLQNEINLLNELIFNKVNNGVYKSGFARSQEAYEEAVYPLFETLDSLEKRLENQDYLLGGEVSEVDWRLLPTLVRFDVGYFSAFKCNLKAIRDYPNLWAYMKNLISKPGVAETIDFDIYRRGYHSISPLRNPHGIVPTGLLMDIF